MDGNFLSSQVSITSQEGFSCMNWLRHSGSTLKMEAARSSETMSTQPTSMWCQYQKNGIRVNVIVKVTHLYNGVTCHSICIASCQPLQIGSHHITHYGTQNSASYIPASCIFNLYPLSYGVPIREWYGSTLLPATREQHDQNCTQSH